MLTEQQESEAIPLRRALRRLVNKLAQLLALATPEPIKVDHYASGETLCAMCGVEYWRHAIDPRAPWLVMLCCGDRVKL